MIYFVLLVSLLAASIMTGKNRLLLLLIASYVFYATWGVGFLAVLILSSLMNYFLGRFLQRNVTLGRLWLGVGLNLFLLVGCKYLLALFDRGAPEADFLSQFVRPIGISFWTLQGLSYLFDIYREEEIDPSLTEFCLYMAFWPTVLSGPICRLTNLLPQFRRIRWFSWEDVSAGATRVMVGLFMTVLARLLGVGLNPGEGVAAAFDQARGAWSGLDVWVLAVAFGFQLFFDFAGYSHMVIGAARLLGIRLDENFNHPYLSPTPSVFWTRWHMSLSFWIRDYVFVPLATFRRDTWWPYIAILVSMTLVGLWHEARLTYLLWGVYHGMLLVAHRLGQRIRRMMPLEIPEHVGRTVSWASTFALVSVGWIFFRASDLSQAAGMLEALLTPAGYLDVTLPRTLYVLTAAVAVCYFATVAAQQALARWRSRYHESIEKDAAGTAPVPMGAGRIAIEVLEFGVARRWWVLGPALVVFAVLGGLVLSQQSVAVPTTPFMYTLF